MARRARGAVSQVRRIVVTGAESTGSTTLAQSLAAALGCEWVPEYGRAYTERRAGGVAAPWRTEEFVLIARAQNALEEAAARRAATGWLVCDTDALATALWQERYMGAASAEVLAVAAAQVRPFARILTGDEIPFVADAIRDGVRIRAAMQQRFREALAADGAPWIEVRGPPAARCAAALAFLDGLVRRSC